MLPEGAMQHIEDQLAADQRALDVEQARVESQPEGDDDSD